MNTTLELPAVDVDKLDTAKPLEVIFQPYQTILEKWEAKVLSLAVTDISQRTEMQQARLARLELKAARVGVEKTRVGLVENLKARTSKIDEVARVIRKKLEGLEETLLHSEQFAERHAAKLKGELKLEREKLLSAYSEGPVLGDLSELSEDAFFKVLEDAKLLKQAKLDAAAKAEAERLAKIESDRLERERLVAEYAKMKAEAEVAARKAEAERKRVEEERAAERRKVQAEREETLKAQEEERKRVEAERAEERRKAKEAAAEQAELARKEKAEAQARADAERKRLEAIAAQERKKAQAEAADAAKVRDELAAKEREEAQRNARAESDRQAVEKAAREAAAAPDKAKVSAYVASIRGIPIPLLKTLDIDIPMLVDNFVQRIEAQAGLPAKTPSSKTKNPLELTP